MSHRSCQLLWRSTHTDLSEALQLETGAPGTGNAPELLQHLDSLFITYVGILQKLELLQDQMVQPQKLGVVGNLLQAIMGRLVEVHRDLVQAAMSETHTMHDTLQDLKQIPSHVEIPIPRYFTRTAERLSTERKVYLGKLLREEGSAQGEGTALTEERAVHIIQMTERGRQGRIRASIMRKIRKEEQREKQRKLLPPVTRQPSQAATLVQKVWRGHNQRRRIVQERAEEFEFIGMVHAADQDTGPVDEATERMHALQEMRWSHYVQDQPRIRQQVLETEGMDIEEILRDHLRNWFIECYNSMGKFPDYPSAEQGGSEIIFVEKTPEQLLSELSAKAEEKERQVAGQGLRKDTAMEEKGKRRKKVTEPKKMVVSQFLPDIIKGQEIYTTVWKGRDDSSNLMQEYDVELEKEAKRKEVEHEIRLQVDELMREELKSLRMAIERDFREPSKAKHRPKKKGKDKATKKKEKDLTAHRSLSSLCDELIDQGLLKPVPHVRLSNYLGDIELSSDLHPEPSLYDIRQIITMYAILPLGSQALHEKAPLVKSMLLAGPLGVGKKMLVHCICTETSATLFDLSAKNIAGKYPGKAGLQMMLHMVLKVAKSLQPSVIWIDDAEKTFISRMSREERALEPKRLRKELPKLLKQIQAEDRVLVVGTSQRPFDADPRPLFKVYERIILVPCADYSARLMIWKDLIERQGGVVCSSLDLASLARISDGYTPGHMAQAVRAVLTEQRLRQQAQHPLTAGDFTTALGKVGPVYLQEQMAFKSWAAKTPLMRGAVRMRREKDALEKAALEAAQKQRKKRQ